MGLKHAVAFKRVQSFLAKEFNEAVKNDELDYANAIQFTIFLLHTEIDFHEKVEKGNGDKPPWEDE